MNKTKNFDKNFINHIWKGVIMVDFNESKTKTNLARAFAGECQAGARYQFIAQKRIEYGKIFKKNLSFFSNYAWG